MSATSRSIRVAVEHGAPLLAAGLSSVLSRQIGIEVVDPPGGAGVVVADVVVADYGRGLWLAGQRPGRVAPRVMVLTVQDREQDVRSALEAGVDGYLAQDCGVHELVQALHQLARGARFLGAAAASRVAESVGRVSLTSREREVLGLVSHGKSNKAIALALDISVGTVKAHMKGVMGKLGAASRTEAARIAVERGF